MKVLGIMSGTSIDGVDYALCEVRPQTICLIQHWSRPLPSRIRRRLHAAAADLLSAHEVAQLHHDLGRLYASQAAALKVPVKLVGLHGQTIFHQPRPPAATLQIGEPAYLARELGVPVVSNFRAADLAAGGQGAPLATLFHAMVFGRAGKHVCVNNLGGISNVTSVDRSRSRCERLMAFDTGPANVLLDLAVRELTRGRNCYDEDGRLAARGRVQEGLLRAWLRHPYFRKNPPKSTGREMFGEEFWQRAWPEIRARKLSLPDTLATLAEFTARSITLNYRLHLASRPDLVVLCGGGTANRDLVARMERSLRSEFEGVEVKTSRSVGWPEASIEAAAFALLAYRSWKRLPGNLPATTGAVCAAVLGQIAFPAGKTGRRAS